MNLSTIAMLVIASPVLLTMAGIVVFAVWHLVLGLVWFWFAIIGVFFPKWRAVEAVCKWCDRRMM